MADAALVWSASGGVSVVELGAKAETRIGRSADAAVQIDDATVSRQQAIVERMGSQFLLRNLSDTNPTSLHGTVPATAVPLMDGDDIKVGKVLVRFHHLASRDLLSGPICSHCGRENTAADPDCWFCGTSLVNASSQVRSRKRVVGRLVDATGAAHDLYAGESAIVRADGGVEVGNSDQQAVDGATVTATPSGLTLDAGDDASVTMAGGEPIGGRQARNGDLLEANGSRVIVLVR